MDSEYLRDGKVVRVASEQRAGRTHVTIDGEEFIVESFTIDTRQIRLVTADGRHLRVPYSRRDGRLSVSVAGKLAEISSHTSDAEDDSRGAGGFTPEVVSPMPGKVLEVLVAVGDEVAHDAPLIRLEAMKMEQTIRAASPARVREVRVVVGAMVGPGAVLLVLEPCETAAIS